MNESEQNINIKRKKGRPRKYPLEEVSNEPKIKNKRGRKKKEHVEIVEKQKKKRGRKAAIPYLTNSVRRQLQSSSVSFQENDPAILYLNIKETIDVKKDITYDVLSSDFFGTVINTINENERSFENENGNNKIKSNIDNFSCSNINDDDILYEYIEKLEKLKITDLDKLNLNIDENLLNKEDITILYDTRLQIRKEQDNILMNKLEVLHKDENLLNKVLDKVTKIKNNDNSNGNLSEINNNNDKLTYQGISPILKVFIDNKENWLNKTDVNCWWCCHSFDTIPIGLPIDYGKNYGDKYNTKKFRVRGVFCSFACMLAYAEDNKNTINYIDFKHLSKYLYKKMTGCILMSKKQYKHDMETILSLDFFFNIKENKEINKNLAEERKKQYIEGLLYLVDETLNPAPSRSTLKVFGGNYTINDFRNKSKERKVCKMINYPMCISRDYHEEVDIKNIKLINDTVFNKKEDSSKYINSQKLIKEANESKIQENNIIRNNVVTKGNIDQFISFN